MRDLEISMEKEELGGDETANLDIDLQRDILQILIIVSHDVSR